MDSFNTKNSMASSDFLQKTKYIEKGGRDLRSQS